jgi:hypothetical protein
MLIQKKKKEKKRFDGCSIGIGTTSSASALAPFTNISISSQQNNISRTQKQRV